MVCCFEAESVYTRSDSKIKVRKKINKNKVTSNFHVTSIVAIISDC